MAGFALISGLLMLLVVGCLQLALTLWVRTILIDTAGEAARQAATFGAPAHAAQNRASQLLSSTLGPDYVTQVSVRTYPSGQVVPGAGPQASLRLPNVQIVEVTLRAPVPLLGHLGGGQMQVTGRAVQEEGPA